MLKHIIQRKFYICPTISGYPPVTPPIVECPTCTMFLCACCQDGTGDWQRTCQHFILMVFTDGACSNNGLVNAKAGLGITMGGDDIYSWSIPVDDAVDPGVPRTNQRAELLAAIEGLKKLHQADRGRSDSYVVVTDSEYVVKGITEWLLSWRNRGWLKSDGKPPANLDLFLALDKYVTSLELNGIEVGFCHIPRVYNEKADKLAKRAAAV